MGASISPLGRQLVSLDNLVMKSVAIIGAGMAGLMGHLTLRRD